MENKPEYWGASGGLEYEAAWSTERCREVGERIWNMEREFNHR